jgi:hypothetical protein
VRQGKLNIWTSQGGLDPGHLLGQLDVRQLDAALDAAVLAAASQGASSGKLTDLREQSGRWGKTARNLAKTEARLAGQWLRATEHGLVFAQLGALLEQTEEVVWRRE